MESQKTKPFMIASAVFLGLLGLGASFAPNELVQHLGTSPRGGQTLFLEVVGALYLGFAALNWMAREHAIGGIYSRPVAVGNFLHFLIVAVLLVQRALAQPGEIGLVVGAGLYSVFAAGFTYLLYGTGDSCG